MAIDGAVVVIQWSLIALVVATILMVMSGKLSATWPAGTTISPFVWTISASGALAIWFANESDLPLRLGRALEFMAGAALPAVGLLTLPPRWRRAAGAALVGCVTLVVYADLLYFRFFEQIVPLSALRAAHQLGALSGVIATLVRWQDGISLLLVFSAVALYLWAGRRSPQRQERRDRRTELCIALLLIWIIGTPLIAARRAGAAIRNHPTTLAALPQAGVLYTHLYDFLLHAETLLLPRSATPEEIAEAERELRARSDWASGVDHFGVASGSNLLLIQLESISSWLVDAEVGGEPVMPFLRSLREQGLYYPTVLSQTNHGGTADAEYIVLNSLHALPRGAVCFLHAGNRFRTLVHALRDSGYSTLAAHGYDREFWNRAIMYPAYGFERSLFSDDFGPGETIGWGLADHVFFERLTPHLHDLEQPYFAFVVTLSSHAPFSDVPPQHRTLNLGDFEGSELGAYLDLARYLDGALQEFLQGLERQGLLENTLVALYGDHTVIVPRHRQLFPMETGANRGTRFSFVPFLVLPPDGELIQTVREPIGQIDIGPTLLHLLGVERPATFLGRPALREINFAARPDPLSAYDDEVMLQRDRCYSRRDGDDVDRALCNHLEGPALRETAVSYDITTYDLVPDLLARAAGEVDE